LGLWALGWTACAIQLVAHALTHIDSLPFPWSFVNLASLGVSSFLLYAGLSHFVGNTFRPRAFLWLLLPILAALVMLRDFPVDERLMAAPVFAFSILVDFLSVRLLFHKVPLLKGAQMGWGGAVAYGTWTGLKLAQLIVPLGDPALIALTLGNTGLTVAISLLLLIASLMASRREARQRARGLDVMFTLTAAAGRTLLPDEILETALDELDELLEGNSSLGVFLYDSDDPGHQLTLVAGDELPLACQREGSHEECACRLAARTGQIVSPQGPLLPPSGCPLDCTVNLAVPLSARERVTGAICATVPAAFRLTDGEQRLLKAIGQHLAIALENCTLHQEVQRRLQELTALHEIDTHIASALELDDLLQAVGSQIQRVFDVSTLYLGLYDPEIDELHIPLIIDHGERREPLRLRASEGAGLGGWVIRSGKPLWIDDMAMERDQLPVQAVALGDPTCTLAVLPLITRGRVVGVLSAQSYVPHKFDAAQKRLLTDIAHQVAVAIENVRLYQQTQHRLTEARVLKEISQTAVSVLDFDRVLERSIGILERELGAEYIGFMLPDEDGQHMISHRSMLGYKAPEGGVFRFPISACITGRVYRTGEPVLVADVTQISDYAPASSDTRSEVAVPVRVGEEVAAVLNVESRRTNAFNADDLAFYTAVAGQLGVALENARLYQAEQRRRREAETLYRAAQALTTTLDLPEVFDRILTELQQTVAYDSASVQLLEDGVLRIIGGRGFPNPEEILGLTFDPGKDDNPNGRVVRSRAPVILEDAPLAYAEFHRQPHKATNIRAWLGVPLLFGDRVIGILALDKGTPGFYTAEHARVALTFAGQAAIAIENAQLYQQIEDQSGRLKEAIRELQELDRLRNQLVQNVSHELRTPLTLIQGYAELLINEDLGPLAAAQCNAIEMIHERAVILARLIYNLTALQAIPREALALVPLSLTEVIRQVLNDYRQLAARSDVRFDLDMAQDLPLIRADRERLALAFLHLIDNAIKFSPDGGTIWIRAWSEKGVVCLSVRDEGIGIAPEHIGRVFERFYQADGSTTRRFGGMGVGLALVWEIVEAHGGEVDVTSEVGRGSIFTVRLPEQGEG
jgi:GAF domain-containing protein/anti-sigma regulatory factor (Ser/Thr protein kinase)